MTEAADWGAEAWAGDELDGWELALLGALERGSRPAGPPAGTWVPLEPTAAFLSDDLALPVGELPALGAFWGPGPRRRPLALDRDLLAGPELPACLLVAGGADFSYCPGLVNTCSA